MNKVDWTNQYLEIHPDEVEKLLIKYNDLGYDVDEDVEMFDEAITPSRDTLTRKNIEEILSRPLIVGDKEQVEALEAAEFLKIAESFYTPYLHTDCQGWDDDV